MTETEEKEYNFISMLSSVAPLKQILLTIKHQKNTKKTPKKHHFHAPHGAWPHLTISDVTLYYIYTPFISIITESFIYSQYILLSTRTERKPHPARVNDRN